MIKLKDRKRDIEYLRMACNMVELGISYMQADLLIRVQERLEELNGNFSLDDGVKILHYWKKEWDEYFKKVEADKTK